MKDQTLINNYTYDYAIPNLVNHVLKNEDDGHVTMVSQLREDQLRPALLLYVKEFNALQKRIEKAIDTLDKLM